MIDEVSLPKIGFDETLPADAPVRLALPPAVKGETWWQIKSSTWVRALPGKSVVIQNTDKSRSTKVRFRSDLPGIAVDEDADWVSNTDALQVLAEELTAGLKRQLAASVPALPTRAVVTPLSELQLDWPGGGDGDFVIRRHRRLAGQAGLTKYTGRTAAEMEKDIDLTRESHSARLLRHLSAIPRPADARVQLVAHQHGSLVLSWEHVGNPDLLWGTFGVEWHGPSWAVRFPPLSPGYAAEKRQLGACTQLLAMATAVEAATGGSAIPLLLLYRTTFDHILEATLTIKPEQWGFDLPQSVAQIMQGQIPDDLSFRMDEK
jgi:hypothetical protein